MASSTPGDKLRMAFPSSRSPALNGECFGDASTKVR